jgi:large subunit ribosomal protein L31
MKILLKDVAVVVYFLVWRIFGSPLMKKDIHPEYNKVVVHCGCGATFETRSTSKEVHAEICSMCHPFYTGKQKFVDTAGRIERFQKKYGNSYMTKKAKKEQ